MKCADAPAHSRLSDRELQVLCLLASGKTVTQIAAKLALSVKTVSTHRSRLLEKMRLQTNAEIIRYAIWHRLVD
jgi:two-component system, NarL family, invasion response regulator UvrY